MAEPKPTQELTLVYPVEGTKENRVGARILLGMKKRGFGQGKWNGFGGKVEAGETHAEAAARELKEESGLIPRSLTFVGEVTFDIATVPKLLHVHVYMCDVFDGTPTESEEMKPEWYNIDKLPYSQMWVDDRLWVPLILNGRTIQAHFVQPTEESISSYKLSAPSPQHQTTSKIQLSV